MQNNVPFVTDGMTHTQQLFIRCYCVNRFRMNWIICYLLLIAFCIAKCSSKRYKKNDTVANTNSIIILGTDGFVGKIRDACKWGECEQHCCEDCKKVLHCNCTNKMFVISFNPHNETHDTYYDSDPGVSLSASSPYTLTLTRNKDPAIICLFQGCCKNLTHKVNLMLQNTSCVKDKNHVKWMLGKDSYFFNEINCTITCLNPASKCQTAQYENCTSKGDINFIKSDSCVKCGSPVNNLTLISLPDVKSPTEAMQNLSSMVSLMGNLTEVSVSMGSAQGVLTKIYSATCIKTNAFIFSSQTGLTVLNDKDKLNDYPITFTVPEEAIEKAFNQSKGNGFLGVFRFPNMTKNDNSSVVLNNEVYAIDMGTKICNLSENVQLSFKYKQDHASPVCVSWDGNGTSQNWTTDGCTTTGDAHMITCSCSHLTFFAVLMNPVDEPIPEQDLVVLTYITYIGCGLSMFFLGIGLFMHFLLRKAKASNSVHVLINLFVALFLLNLTFLSNEYVTRMNHNGACRVVAGFMHYCMLASFTWFAVEAFHLCLQMAKPTVTIDHYITKISVAGWVPPALVVTVFFIFGKYGEKTIQTNTRNNETMCWILDSTVHNVVNIGYYSIVFIFTFSTFIVVLRWLCMLRQRKWTKISKHSGTGSSDITTIMGLCCLLGLTWSFSFFSYGALRVPSYYIFTILNSFQGFFLFIYYVKSSHLFGDPAPSTSNKTSEDTKTENPYVD